MVKPAAIIAALFAFSTPLLLIGCAEEGMVETIQSVVGEKEAFEQAQTDKTSQEWNSFIEKYPNSDKIEIARRQLRIAYWKEARQSDTPEAYLDFIQNHPQSSHLDQARTNARRLLLADKGSLADLLRYLTVFPKDDNAQELRRVLEKKRFTLAKNASGPEETSLFIAQYPGTRDALSLKKKRQSDKFQMAQALGTRLAYHWFLENFPNSPEAVSARSQVSIFNPKYFPADQKTNVDNVISQMRLQSPDFRKYECWTVLSQEIKREPNIFGSRAESLRLRLISLLQTPQPTSSEGEGDIGDISLSGDSSSSQCSKPGGVLPSKKQIVLNAIGALNKLAGERRRLSSLIGNPQAVVAQAASLSQTASSFADDAEGKEEEEAALYNQGSENPDNPKETASVVARDAMRRARYALQVSQSMTDNSDSKNVINKMDSQAKLLMLIIAESEKVQ